jgi:hypothetical protein
VAAVSAGNVWAVGWAAASATAASFRPLIVHWNGQAWRRLPSPVPAHAMLNGVAADAADSAWAVGQSGSGSSGRTLTMHWNGTTWRRVPSPSPGLDANLAGVAVGPAGRAWAVGFTESAPGDPHLLILAWNGTAWVRVPAPGAAIGELTAVTARSASSLWAVGYAATGTGAGTRTLILHGNGRSWRRVPSPDAPGLDPILYGASTGSASSAWAFGTTFPTPHSVKSMVMRWNGSAWQLEPSPGPARNSKVDGTAVLAAGTAWAVGYTSSSGPVRAQKTLIVRWNGSSWQRLPSPTPVGGGGLTDIAAVSASNIWAVGAGGKGKVLILHWNGSVWK